MVVLMTRGSVSVKNGRHMTVMPESIGVNGWQKQPPCPYIVLVFITMITTIGSTVLALHIVNHITTFRDLEVCHAWCNQTINWPNGEGRSTVLVHSQYKVHSPKHHAVLFDRAEKTEKTSG